jgi:hypothetical protein
MSEQEFKSSAIMSKEDRVIECYSAIMMALEAFECKFDVTCMLSEKGTDFKINVIPKEDDEDAS